MPTKANYVTAGNLLPGWHDNLLSGQPPVLYPPGTGDLARIEIGPKRVLLIGGGPGAGKTALTTQLTIDALRLTPNLKACICNVEMPPDVLLDRQLARFSGIDLRTVRFRQFGAEHADRIDRAFQTIDALGNRLCFVRPPYSLDNVAATADEFGPDVILLDYIQRIRPHSDQDSHRGAVNETMDFLRQFADTGIAVVVVSAVGRTRDSSGRSSYTAEGLNLASYRESSELEYGADDAFILCPEDDDPAADIVTLRQLKSRYGQCTDIPLSFDRPRQRFASASNSQLPPDNAALQALWANTSPATDEEEDRDD